MLRTWEAPAPHADQAILEYNAELASEVVEAEFDATRPAWMRVHQRGPQARVVLRSPALRDGGWSTAPSHPRRPPAQERGEAIVRDQAGASPSAASAHPEVDAPVSVLTSEAPAGPQRVLHAVRRVPLDAATSRRCTLDTHETYVASVTDSANAADAGSCWGPTPDAFIEAAGEPPTSGIGAARPATSARRSGDGLELGGSLLQARHAHLPADARLLVAAERASGP